MSYPGETSIDARVRAVEAEYRRLTARRLGMFAIVEAALLAVAAVVVYVLRLVDDQIGMWIVLAIAVAGGLAMTMIVRNLTKGRAAAIAQARGENPLV